MDPENAVKALNEFASFDQEKIDYIVAKASVAALDEWGYFDSREDCRTATPGVFCAGDARQKKIRQITTATADGAVSALAACSYIDSL